METTTIDTARRPTVIDCQWHWYPRSVCEAYSGRRDHPRWRRQDDGFVFEPTATESWAHPPQYVDLDRQLEIMQGSGIDAIVASPVLAGDVSALELAEAIDLATMFNEELAAAQREHPGRVFGLAVLPQQDAAAASDCLDDAIDRLGLVGAVLHSNVDGRSIADREHWPLYERAAERRVPLFLHPTRTFAPARVHDYRLEPPLHYMFDTTIAAMSMIVSGLLDAVPELAIVHPHLGATLPILVDRLDVYRRLGRWDTPRSIREYLPHFYTDTVSESPEALRMALDLYGPERVLFASDHPYFPPESGLRFVEEHAPAEALAGILAHNAEALLGIEVTARA